MTAQAEDIFRYKGKEYSIVAISNEFREPSPTEYGISPMDTCKARYSEYLSGDSGFWYSYSITDEGLFLQDIHVNSSEGKYPAINGVLPEKGVDSLGLHVYKNVNIKKETTCKLLLGSDFISDYYIHMEFQYTGFQWPWAYETLTEFVFEKGILVEINDQSEMAKHLRDIMIKKEGFMDFFNEKILNHISECFSFDYAIKAWWLPEGDFKVKGFLSTLLFSLHNNRNLHGGNLLRDLITSIEHPDLPFIDVLATPEIIHRVLKRKNIEFSKIKWIILGIGSTPLGNIDGLLDFCEEAHRSVGAKVSLWFNSHDLGIKNCPPPEKISGKVDSITFRIFPGIKDKEPPCNIRKAILGTKSYDETFAFISELKIHVPDIVVSVFTDRLSKETIEECRRIVEDELQVKFEN